MKTFISCACVFIKYSKHSVELVKKTWVSLALCIEFGTPGKSTVWGWNRLYCGGYSSATSEHFSIKHTGVVCPH